MTVTSPAVAFSQALRGLGGRAVRIEKRVGLLEASGRFRVHVDLLALTVNRHGAKLLPLPDDLALPISEEEYAAQVAAQTGKKVVRMSIRPASRRRQPDADLMLHLARLLPESNHAQLHYALSGGPPIHDVYLEDATLFAVAAQERGVKVALAEERALALEDIRVPPLPAMNAPGAWTPPNTQSPDAFHANSALRDLRLGACALEHGAPAVVRGWIGRVATDADHDLRLLPPKGAARPYLGQPRSAPVTSVPIQELYVLAPEEADWIYCMVPVLGAAFADLVARATPWTRPAQHPGGEAEPFARADRARFRPTEEVVDESLMAIDEIEF